MKKGFTLVELLAVLAIISILLVIIIPNVAGRIKESKEKALKVQITTIENAASDWALENGDKLDSYHLNPTFVSLSELKETAFIKDATITNPVTDEEMNGCVLIKYVDETNSYSYTYNEKSCDDLKKDYPTITSAYETIMNNESTVVKGSGLYEIDNEYVYRGDDSNNYLKIGQNDYRIISLDKDKKTLKVIKTTGDSKNWEESTDASEYSFRVASINTYLNSDFYGSLDSQTTSLIQTNTPWYIGPISGDKMSITTLKSTEQSSTYNVNIGLLTLYEYARASLSDSCNNDYNDDGCKYDNYLNFGSNYWLINNYKNSVWYVDNSGKISINDAPKDSLYKVYPVFVLKVNTVITGKGTSSDPYVIAQ